MSHHTQKAGIFASRLLRRSTSVTSVDAVTCCRATRVLPNGDRQTKRLGRRGGSRREPGIKVIEGLSHQDRLAATCKTASAHGVERPSAGNPAFKTN